LPFIEKIFGSCMQSAPGLVDLEFMKLKTFMGVENIEFLEA
jgi:hypothetical protein